MKAPFKVGYEDDDLSWERKKVKRMVEDPKKLEFEEMAAYALSVASDKKFRKNGLERWKKKFNLFSRIITQVN